MNRMKEKKLKRMKGGIALLFIVILVAALITMGNRAGGNKVNRLLDLGNKYLEDLDFESAIVTFDQAIAIDPKCEEAYYGKAQAQYMLGRFEEAMKTLQEGIPRVDDPTRLIDFLQQITDEYLRRESVEVDPAGQELVEREGTEEADKAQSERKLLQLNYIEIQRTVDTQDPEIQLSVLGDEGNEKNYSWISSDEECVRVSETGLLVCQPKEGYAKVWAENASGNISGECEVRIFGYEVPESEKMRASGEEQDFTVNIQKAEEGVTIDVLGKYIYYSGDIDIPEKLEINGRNIPVTGITGSAFNWSDEMNSIRIPDTVSAIDDFQNPFTFCTNLKEIIVDENNAFFKSVDGVLYSKDGTVLYSYPAAKSDETFLLPKEVKKVSRGAFTGCRNLKTISVEDGNEYYQSINNALIWIKDPASLVAYPIGNEASSFIVPEVRSIDPNVFYLSMLEEIDCSLVANIDEGAFRQCNDLTKIQGGECTEYIYWGVQNYWNDEDKVEMEFTGFEKMRNLRQLSISLAGTQDTSQFGKLESLESLKLNANGRLMDLEILSGLTQLSDIEVWGLEQIKDFSWVEGKEELQRIELHVKQLQDIDLTPLLNLKKLSRIEITCELSSEPSEGMKQQIAEIREQKPELDISICE